MVRTLTWHAAGSMTVCVLSIAIGFKPCRKAALLAPQVE